MNAITRSTTTFFAAIGVFASCRTAHSVLELRDVREFTLLETRDGEGTHLELNGLAFHSALCVDGFRMHRERADLVVRPILVSARHELSGSFRHTVDVPDDVMRVVFGEERSPIWERAEVPAHSD